MDYERHVRLELQIDVLEHRGPRVDIKPQAVPAHAGVLRCHVVAEAMVAKYFVLGTCDVPSRGPRAYRRDARFERLVVYSEGPLLRLARFSEHEGAADLRVITVHARGQLGRHQVAGREAPFRRRMHPAHFTSAGAQDLEILGAAAGAEKSLDFRDERIFRPPHARRFAKNGVAFVGEDGGAVQRLDLGRRLPQHQMIEQGRRTRNARDQGPHRKAIGHCGERRDGGPPLAELADRGLGFLDRRERPSHIELRLLRAQARGLCRALDDDPRRPFAVDERKGVPFDRSDVGCKTQIVAAPRISGDDEDVDPLLRHRSSEACAPLGASVSGDLVHSGLMPPSSTMDL